MTTRSQRGESTTEADAQTGYRSWSASYDEPGNPIIELEEPAVWSLIDPLARGRRARRRVRDRSAHAAPRRVGAPGRRCRPHPGDVGRGARLGADGRVPRPAISSTFPPTTRSSTSSCAGSRSRTSPISTRPSPSSRAVSRPGGHVVLSALHPFQAFLGWHAPFEDEAGQRRFVREHSHTHADYSRRVPRREPARPPLHRTRTHRGRSRGQAPRVPQLPRCRARGLPRHARSSRVGRGQDLTRYASWSRSRS